MRKRKKYNNSYKKNQGSFTNALSKKGSQGPPGGFGILVTHYMTAVKI